MYDIRTEEWGHMHVQRPLLHSFKASTISHAGDDHRPQVVGGVRAGVLQDVGPDEAVQLQEEPAHRAALQQVRGEQGRLEDLQDQEEEELRSSSLLYAASTDLIKSSRNLEYNQLCCQFSPGCCCSPAKPKQPYVKSPCRVWVRLGQQWGGRG